MNAQPSPWIAITVVAQIYGVETDWLVRIEEMGLVRVERRQAVALLASADLDRIAAAVRWNRHLGIDLETVAAMFGLPYPV